MHIFNTLSGKKEDLEEVLGGKKRVNLFVCGPTVYDYVHIGNARTYSAFDLIVRYLRYRGFKVFYLQNITDIDDKIIRRANEQKLPWQKLAKKYERAYHEAERSLGITAVSRYAPATKYIKEIVRQVQTLVAKGHAYKIEGDGYYYDITTFPEYGKLSKRTAAQAEDSVSRIDESVHKRNKGDFALWKLSKPGEPSWKTSLGSGRPGWHIEDTAITEYQFGPQYDLHGGGIDLKFPHHEAEIAQEEAASGKKPMVKIWMHSGFLNIDSEKMSKSRGGFVSVRDFLTGHSPAIFRYLVASHHYRSPVDYSDELARQAESTLDNLAQFAAKLDRSRGEIRADVKSYEPKFLEKMDDDFNTPEALAVIFELVNKIQAVKNEIWNLNRLDAKAIKKWITEKLKILGVALKAPKIPLKIRFLARRRELYRSNKQFTQSDVLRKEIEALGYTTEDTPSGPFLWPKLS